MLNSILERPYPNLLMSFIADVSSILSPLSLTASYPFHHTSSLFLLIHFLVSYIRMTGADFGFVSRFHTQSSLLGSHGAIACSSIHTPIRPRRDGPVRVGDLTQHRICADRCRRERGVDLCTGESGEGHTEPPTHDLPECQVDWCGISKGS